jgi:hypothetical protein
MTPHRFLSAQKRPVPARNASTEAHTSQAGNPTPVRPALGSTATRKAAKQRWTCLPLLCTRQCLVTHTHTKHTLWPEKCNSKPARPGAITNCLSGPQWWGVAAQQQETGRTWPRGCICVTCWCWCWCGGFADTAMRAAGKPSQQGLSVVVRMCCWRSGVIGTRSAMEACLDARRIQGLG